MLGGVILSGEALQLARSAGVRPDVVDAGEAATQPRQRLAAAMAHVWCFQTGFPIQIHVSDQSSRR